MNGPRKTYRRSTGQKCRPQRPAEGRGLEIRYINLENRLQRRLEIEERLREAGLFACSSRFDAMTGDDAPEALVSFEWDSRLNARYDKTTLPHPRVPMTRGERGCAMSHACLWAACAARPDDSWPLVVLEDDVELAPAFALHLARVVAKVDETFRDPKSRSFIVYLGADVASWANEALNAPQKKQRVRAEANALFSKKNSSKTLKLLAATYVWQTSSYVLWPPAARALVANLPVAEPVDNFISRQLLRHQLSALVVVPFLARQVAAYCDGDIVHSRPAVACPDGDQSTPLAPIW